MDSFIKSNTARLTMSVGQSDHTHINLPIMGLTTTCIYTQKLTHTKARQLLNHTVQENDPGKSRAFITDLSHAHRSHDHSTDVKHYSPDTLRLYLLGGGAVKRDREKRGREINFRWSWYLKTVLLSAIDN